MKKQYRPVIGLEIHAQLDTHSKIFCHDAVDFGGEPNTRVSPITLGHPGTLPMPNIECIKMAIKMGLATHCEIRPHTHFARKNYYYPDLPKGYQITQDETPICFKGHIEIRLKDSTKKTIGITRIHIEEDAGKSIHDQDPFDTLIDLNRAGVGLIEIVSEPDIENAEQAMIYLNEIRKIVRYLDICDGNMEEGSLRCDANISVMPINGTEYGTRVEVKNMNSISNVGKAINHEIERQIALIESGGKVLKETRTWDAMKEQTAAMREKESADDYRYFPEPDLSPVFVDIPFINGIKTNMPELPEILYQRYTKELGLPDFDATVLTEQKEFAYYFENVLKEKIAAKPASNWMIGSVRGYLNEQAVDIKRFPLQPKAIAAIISLVENGKVSISIAKEKLFKLLIENPNMEPETLAKENQLILENDWNEIETHINNVLSTNTDKVEQYLQGKTGLLGFFVGQVMRLSGGKADPKVINQMMSEALEKQRS